MKVTAKINKEFPALAWISNVSGERIEIIHGEHVDMKENFWVEGAWSGEFDQGMFADAEWFCGTGGGNKIKRSNLFYT